MKKQREVVTLKTSSCASPRSYMVSLRRSLLCAYDADGNVINAHKGDFKEC